MSLIGFRVSDSLVKLEDFENLREIKPYENELEKLRVEQINATMKAVTDVRGSLETLKRIVYNDSMKIRDCTDHLKNKMLYVEEKIIHIKETIKLRMLLLLKDETTLLNELDCLKGKLEDWSKFEKLKPKKNLKQSTYKISKIGNENPTTQFQSFLLTFGGHYGGWEEHDHLVFLKERNRFKGKPKFFAAVQDSLPGLSYDEIIDHEKWYVKYDTLKKTQKSYIQNWKCEKVKQKSQIVKSEEEKENKPIVRAKNQKDIAERIKKWKEQQLIKKLEEEERQRNDKLKLLEEEKKKKEIQKIKKLAVQKFKMEKFKKMEEEIFLKKGNPVPSMDPKLSNALWKSFRLQDMKFIEKRKLIQMQIKQKICDKMKRSPKPFVELGRDPKRVLQPTLGWTLRLQQKNKKEDTELAFNLDAIPRLTSQTFRRHIQLADSLVSKHQMKKTRKKFRLHSDEDVDEDEDVPIF